MQPALSGGQVIQGYRIFRCSICKCAFNERSGTPFNSLEYPTDIVLLVVLYRFRYKLSLRDLAEMFLERGFQFTHETARDWEARFALSLLSTYAENDVDKQAPAGMSMKRTEKCTGTGAPSLVRLIMMGTSLIPW